MALPGDGSDRTPEGFSVLPFAAPVQAPPPLPSTGAQLQQEQQPAPAQPPHGRFTLPPIRVPLGQLTAATLASSQVSSVSSAIEVPMSLDSSFRFTPAAQNLMAHLSSSCSSSGQTALQPLSDQQYRQTVLSAFAQVADVLYALEYDAGALDAQSRALAAAQEALRLLRADYRAGTVDYLQILVADGQLHQAQIAWLEAAAQRLQDTVALYAALGGGWGDMAAPREGASADRPGGMGGMGRMGGETR